MTIEQEFFEAFGIEPKYRYREYGNCHAKKEACTTYCKEYTRYDFCVYYPPITPEIVLGLFDILLFGWEVKIIKPQVEDGFWYRIFLFKESEFIWFKTTLRPTFEDAIMDLLIQLQPEIQDQVLGLFNNSIADKGVI